MTDVIKIASAVSWGMPKESHLLDQEDMGEIGHEGGEGLDTKSL